MRLEQMEMNLDKLHRNLATLSPEQLDDILDVRDSEPFDSSWCELNELVGGDEQHPDAEDIFVEISSITNQHKITSYIADDIDLIHRAELKGIDTQFLQLLKRSYEEGTVPKEVDA